MLVLHLGKRHSGVRSAGDLRRWLTTLACVVFGCEAHCLVQAAQTTSFSSHAWNISVDDTGRIDAIGHDQLGVILEDVRLHLKHDGQLREARDLKVVEKGPRQLVVATAEPAGVWTFEPSENQLAIRCSVPGSTLTASAPATSNRIPARVIDPHGKPVTWSLTNELEVRGWSSQMQRHRSFLPRQNPHVMYLSLGQVSSLNFHCLFDRQTNSVIQLPETAKMLRDDADENRMRVTFPVAADTQLELISDYYTKVLGLPRYKPIDDSYFDRAPTNWCSWSGYYDDVTEKNITDMADWIADNLRDYGLQYMTLDDGYDRTKESRQHHWISHWDEKKFPSGPKYLTDYVKSKGLKLGVWLVPCAYAGAVEEHPDWYLKTGGNDWIYDYNTPALDYTHPEVLEFLRKLFTTFNEWGFEYYKFDGEGALAEYVGIVDKTKLHNPTADGIEAYRRRSQLIRETVGPKRFIEGCPAGMPMDCIDMFDSHFTGCDVYNSWMGMQALFSSISANTFLTHIVGYIMPDGVDVRPQLSWEEAQGLCYGGQMSPRVMGQVFWREEEPAGFGVTMDQAKTIVTFVALSGATYCCTNVFTDLPDERVRLLKMTMPAMPIVPIDLFSRGADVWDVHAKVPPDGYDQHNYPEIMDLKVNSAAGVYDVVAAFNWSKDETTSRNISFRYELGLEDDTPYLVFDFWNQRLHGVFHAGFTTELAPLQTGAYLIRPLLERPQLMGTSRHITGSQSILDLKWDAAQSKLVGRSAAVAGDQYVLWSHVPAGFDVSGVAASDAHGKMVTATYSVMEKSTLRVIFRGQATPVDWSVSFTARPKTGR